MNKPVNFKKWIIVTVISFGFTILFIILGVAFSGFGMLGQLNQFTGSNIAHNMGEMMSGDGLNINVGGVDNCEDFTFGFGDQTLMEVNCDQETNSMMDDSSSMMDDSSSMMDDSSSMMDDSSSMMNSASTTEIKQGLYELAEGIELNSKADLDGLMVNSSLYAEAHNYYNTNRQREEVSDYVEDIVEGILESMSLPSDAKANDEDYKDYFEREFLSGQDTDDYIEEYFTA